MCNWRTPRLHSPTASLRLERASRVLYVLQSSVCAKPFASHSYGNCRGVLSFSPIWFGLATRSLATITVFCFQALAHSFATRAFHNLFAIKKFRTLCQKRGGWG